MNERLLYKADKIILVSIFLFFIYTPFFAGIIQDDRTASKVEKRTLATLPPSPTSLIAFSEYPKKFNTYYSDHFGFREKLTKKYFKLINKLGDETSFDDVTIGKNGWLFLGSTKPNYKKHNDPLGDAMNINLYSDESLQRFSESLTTIRNWLRDREVEYIYVIAPNKHTIYFENLPNFITKKNEKSSTDQIIEHLKKHTNISALDLRQPLLNEKKKHQVYFKTDTHWNQYGANVAQYELMRKVKEFFPKEIKPFLLGNTQFKLLTTKGGDLASFAKIENITEVKPHPIFKSACTPIKEKSKDKQRNIFTMTCDTGKLNAVIFSDSFITAMQPYISRQFRRSTYIRGKINYDLLKKYIEKEKPDIVIEEIVERKLPYIPATSLFNSAEQNNHKK